MLSTALDHSVGHDMSDPAMARAMEADMRRRFWVALVFTIPIVRTRRWEPRSCAFTYLSPLVCRATGSC